MKKTNFFFRANKWLGNNLVITSLLIAGIISFWPSQGPSLYLRESLDTASQGRNMNHAPMMSSRSNFNGIAKMAMPESVHAQDFAPEESDRKITRNASLQIEVKDTEVARTEIEELAYQLDGHITNLNSYEVRPHVLSYNFTVRIPSDKLDDALKEFTDLGIKKSESMNEQDITAQYADTANRLQNLESRRDRLRELMEQETDSLSDVLSIDRELSSVQQQIEGHERTLKRHDTNVEFSTINLSVQPEPEIGDFQTPEWTPNRSWKQAVNDLIVSLQEILDQAIQILVFAPIWLPILLLIWVIQRFIRRRNKK